MLQAIDDAILLFIQQHFRTAFGDAVLPVITFLGNSGLIWIISAILLFSFRKRKAGAVVALALVLSLLVGNFGLKLLIERPRPCDVDPSVVLLIPHPGEFSFPSGHSMSSFAAAASILFFHKKWGIAAMILAGLIAFSRLYLYVHYPTDVLAGALIGVALAFLSRFLIEQMLRSAARKEDLQ